MQRRVEITSVIFFLLVFGGTLALDQGAKFIFRTYPEISGAFFRLTENSGIAFSIPFSSKLLGALLFVILFFLTILCIRSIRCGNVRETVCYALLLGGGVSNSMDRLRFGVVHDIFVLPGGLLFNLADVAIIAGIFLLFVWRKKFILHPS